MSTVKRARFMTTDSTKSLPYIPDDLFFKILIRLPAESLQRFKTVCKNWRTMIEEEEFVLSHDEYGPRITVPFIHADNHAVVAFCGGIVLEQNLISTRFRVRNPCLRLVVDLPNPTKTSSAMEFAYGGQFKLISFYDDDEGNKGCQVLTFNEDNLSWKTVPAPPEFSNKNRKVFHSRRRRYSEWVIQYFWTDTSDKSGKNFKIGVESFYAKSESFSSSTCLYPPDFFRNFHEVVAVCWCDDCVAVCALDEDEDTMKLHATVLVDLETSKWSDTEPYALSPVDITEDEFIFHSRDVDMEVRVNSHSEMVSWIGEIGEFMIKDKRMLRPLPCFDNLRHTLVAFRGMQPETKT